VPWAAPMSLRGSISVQSHVTAASPCAPLYMDPSSTILCTYAPPCTCKINKAPYPITARVLCRIVRCAWVMRHRDGPVVGMLPPQVPQVRKIYPESNGLWGHSNMARTCMQHIWGPHWSAYSVTHSCFRHKRTRLRLGKEGAY